MKVFKEFVEDQNQVSTLDDLFQDDALKQGESFEIAYNQTNGQFELTVFNADDAPIGTVKIDDPQSAVQYLNNLFGLVPYDSSCADPAGQANGTLWGQGAGSTQTGRDDDTDGTPQGA